MSQIMFKQFDFYYKKNESFILHLLFKKNIFTYLFYLFFSFFCFFGVFDVDGHTLTRTNKKTHSYNICHAHLLKFNHNPRCYQTRTIRKF